MKKIFAPLLFFILVASCNKTENTIAPPIVETPSFRGILNSEAPFSGNLLFFKDVPYGSGERNKLDLILPKGKEIQGMVIFFHGGSFQFGKKEDLYGDELNSLVTIMINSNIAIASVGYSFITDSNSQGVFSSLEDGSDAIEFIRQNSASLNIPSDKIVLAGVSAGAGIALWNGLQEETNDEVEGIVALYTQSTYDLYKWNDLFSGFDLDSIRATDPEIEELFSLFYGGEYNTEKASQLDFSEYIDANDPSLYLYNPTYEDDVFEADTLNLDVLFHSFKHADVLRAKATEVGLDFSGAYKEFPQYFITRILLD